MIESSRPSIQIDLNEFKLHLHLKNRIQLTLHFNSPSRRFYLSVIALVVNEMKKAGKIKVISLQEHLDLIALLNETVGGAAGSSDKENLLSRIYRKWKNALPNLEEAPLFKVIGRKKAEGDGAIVKIYSFNDLEKDAWANLFEYRGSEENVSLKFAIDKMGIGVNDVLILFKGSLNGDAWDQFISSLKTGQQERPLSMEEASVPEPPELPFSPSPKPQNLWRSKCRWILLMGAVGILAAGIWRIFLSLASIEVASVERMKYPLPDNPSIAVMPFANMSEDPKQEFLCDGMTEEIITALTKMPRLFVIARNSTFAYKGKLVKVKQISEELGIRYVLEGSVQRSGNRLRVGVQLIDALTGGHLWAESYDRDLKDIFALQDEITVKILTGVQAKLALGGDVLVAQKLAEKYYRGKQGLDCYFKFLQGRGYYDRWNIQDSKLARRTAEEMVAMCPENPVGYMLLGWIHHQEYVLGSTESPQETIEKAIDLAQKSLSIDDSLPNGHGLLCMLYTVKGEYDKALAEGERAATLDPSGTPHLNSYAYSLNFSGQPEKAIPLFEKIIRFNPIGPSYLYQCYGTALRDTERFEEAVSAFKKAIRLSPDNIYAHAGLAVTYSMIGREKEALAEAAEVLRIDPKYSVGSFAKNHPYKDQSQTDRVVSAMRKAGLK
jgi:adenylate cyclase